MSFISADQALRNSLNVSDEKLLGMIRNELVRVIRGYIIEIDGEIRETSKHGGISCRVFIQSSGFMKFGCDMDAQCRPLLGEINKLVAENFPPGYKVKAEGGIYPSLIISWGDKITCDFSHVDQKALVDAVLYGNRDALRRRLPDKAMEDQHPEKDMRLVDKEQNDQEKEEQHPEKDVGLADQEHDNGVECQRKQEKSTTLFRELCYQIWWITLLHVLMLPVLFYFESQSNKNEI